MNRFFNRVIDRQGDDTPERYAKIVDDSKAVGEAHAKKIAVDAGWKRGEKSIDQLELVEHLRASDQATESAVLPDENERYQKAHEEFNERAATRLEEVEVFMANWDTWEHRLTESPNTPLTILELEELVKEIKSLEVLDQKVYRVVAVNYLSKIGAQNLDELLAKVLIAAEDIKDSVKHGESGQEVQEQTKNFIAGWPLYAGLMQEVLARIVEEEQGKNAKQLEHYQPNIPGIAFEQGLVWAINELNQKAEHFSAKGDNRFKHIELEISAPNLGVKRLMVQPGELWADILGNLVNSSKTQPDIADQPSVLHLAISADPDNDRLAISGVSERPFSVRLEDLKVREELAPVADVA